MGKKKIAVVCGVALFIVLWVARQTPPLQVLHVGDALVAVEIVDTVEEQTKGLSNRLFLAEDKGMLFAYQDPVIPSFWMKDVRFPLDMIWIDAQGRVLEITKDVSPETYPSTISPASPVVEVLEVRAGWAERHKIRVGDMVSF